MDLIKISDSLTDGVFRIEGFPDAVAVVSPTDKFPSNLELIDLALHQNDLMVAGDALAAINRVNELTIQNYLWEYSVVKVTKCFKRSESRKKLDYQKVLGQDPTAVEVIDYFLAMRDKFIVHDENVFMGCNLGLVIAGEGKPYTVEKVVTPSFHGITLSQENYSNLTKLINESLIWVRSEYDRLARQISDHYEELGRAQLLAFPELRLDFHTSASDIKTKRPKSPVN